MSDMTYMPSQSDWPDPDLDTQFYDGVVGKRLAAWFIDAVLIFILSTLSVVVFGLFTLGIGFAFAPLIAVGVTFAYRAATIAGASATPGMRMMGIEFRTRTGDRFDGLHAALHTGIFMLVMMTLIGWLISGLMMLGSRYRQGLPDLLLGTIAINKPIE